MARSTLFLTTKSGISWPLLNELKKIDQSIVIAYETPISKIELLSKRFKLFGYSKVFGQLLFLFYIRILKKLTFKRTQEMVLSSGYDLQVDDEIPCVEFISVNDDEFQQWLKEMSFKAVVVLGTRIIHKNTLDISDAVFINTHCGITPHYRGLHGGYWALAKGDPKNLGVTVHLIDPGIDTGSVIYQARIVIDKWDNFLTYPIKQMIAAIPLVRMALNDILGPGLSLIKKDDSKGDIWSHPTIGQYLINFIKFGVK